MHMLMYANDMRIFAYGSHILAYILGYSMVSFNVFKRKKLPDAEITKEKKALAIEEKKQETKALKPQRALGWSGGILIAPHVTEKSSGLAGLRQFVFRVSPDANKITIARAVEK